MMSKQQCPICLYDFTDDISVTKILECTCVDSATVKYNCPRCGHKLRMIRTVTIESNDDSNIQ